MPELERDCVFRIRKNRLSVMIKGVGFVPVATSSDDVPVFKAPKPKQIGDESIVYVEGQHRKVKLLPSEGMVKDSLFLVDMGVA